MKFFGVDYGAKKAGTTAICIWAESDWEFFQSKKNEDADLFLTAKIRNTGVQNVFIDAPLSLPFAYFGRSDDFHFRQADRELKAMSPMFLGGLTARAMALKHKLHQQFFYESYPSGIVNQLNIREHYKTSLEAFLVELNKQLPYKNCMPENWHQVDAALAWLIGWRYFRDEAIEHGNPDEGIIYT